jgi:hypothetical protein
LEVLIEHGGSDALAAVPYGGDGIAVVRLRPLFDDIEDPRMSAAFAAVTHRFLQEVVGDPACSMSATADVLTVCLTRLHMCVDRSGLALASAASQ